MDYFEERLEQTQDILDNEMKTKNLLHFKYTANIDKEVKLKASFYNSGLHLTDASRLRLNVSHGRFRLVERILNLKEINTEVAYDTDNILPNSEIKGVVEANLQDREIQMLSLGFGYHEEGKFDMETRVERTYEGSEDNKEDADHHEAHSHHAKKSWKAHLYHEFSGSLFSSATASLGFGLSGKVDFEEKGAVFSLPDAGLTYQRKGQSHSLLYQVERIGKNTGLLQYLCHKDISDQTALALRIGRELDEKQNSLEFGLRYRPRNDIVMRAKVDHEGYVYSGLSFQINEFIKASVATRHNFKSYPKTTTPNQCGIMRTPMLFRLTFGV